MRLRVVPVLGTSPSIFGQAMASYVLCSLAGRLYEPTMTETMSKNLKHKMRQALQNNEVWRYIYFRNLRCLCLVHSDDKLLQIKRFGSASQLDLDDEDFEFIVSQVWYIYHSWTFHVVGQRGVQVWRNRCAVTGRKFGGHAPLVLTRWNASQAPTPYNMILLMQEAAAQLIDKGGTVLYFVWRMCLS
jgi:hypothetical protein